MSKAKIYHTYPDAVKENERLQKIIDRLGSERCDLIESSEQLRTERDKYRMALLEIKAHKDDAESRGSYVHSDTVFDIVEQAIRAALGGK